MVIGAAGPDGPFWVHHNYVTNLVQHFCETGADPTGAVIIEYNLVNDPGIGLDNHLNLVQLYDGNVDGARLYRFNAYKQKRLSGAEGPQGYFGHGGISSYISDPTFSNNVFIALLNGITTTASYMIHGPDGNAPQTIVTGTRECSENYFYLPGAFGPFYPGSLDGYIDDSSNVYMDDGSIAALP